jgi:hypothetical protein
VLLFSRILNFKKSDADARDKRGAKRYPVGAKSLIKARLNLPAHDAEGNPLRGDKNPPTDWGGQLVDLSSSGASIRLHPAAMASAGDSTCLKLELDNMLFEIEANVAHFRINQQYVSCGVVLNFCDSYARKAYLQLMEPVVIGSTLEPVTTKVIQDTPGLIKQLYAGESESQLGVWRDETERNPKHFELLIHDYYVRGSTESPGLQIGYRDGTKVGKRVSRPSFPVAMSADHQQEVRRLFQFIVPNLAKGVSSDVRKLLELSAV